MGGRMMSEALWRIANQIWMLAVIIALLPVVVAMAIILWRKVCQ